MGIVVVLGSLMTDLVARAPRLPQPSESLIGDDFTAFLGGKAINQAIVVRRLGTSVTMGGTYAKKSLRWYRRRWYEV
ncbi:MAG TPA: PfkB family carbohydrate kinase [Ktedonobacteraceae bacterium]|jgi:ribokinase